MKKSLLVYILLFVSSLTAFSRDITAYLSYSAFNIPNGTPYLETYLTVVGSSVAFKKNQNNKFQGVVAVTIDIKQGNKIIDSHKYELNSPEANDSISARKLNFIDQQRFTLPSGTYTLELSVSDKVSNGQTFKNTFPVSISFNDDVSVSDIQLIDSYSKSAGTNPLSKSGYDLVPYTSDLYPKNMDKLKLYAEVYNTNKKLGSDARYLLSTYIESYDYKAVVEGYNSFTKENATNVTPIIKEFNISGLPSGNYYAVVEARDAKNELLSLKKIFFQRSNPLKQVAVSDSADLANIKIENTFASRLTPDSLVESIKVLQPILSPIEWQFAKNQLKEADDNSMRRFLYYFWSKKNPLNPENAFTTYQENVVKVNNTFGSYSLKGYLTDRGHVYLRYGAPSDKVESVNETGAYPYEVWHFNQITGKTNRIFVFYLPEYSGNNYKLLHSDVPGEYYNPNWQVEIYRVDKYKNPTNVGMDAKIDPSRRIFDNMERSGSRGENRNDNGLKVD